MTKTSFYKKLKVLTAKPEFVFVTLLAVFGPLSLLLTPQLSANDEGMHFLRAYSVASGNISGTHCAYPKDINDKVMASFVSRFDSDYDEDIDYTSVMEQTCGSAAGYSPVMHFPQATGIFLAKLADFSLGGVVLMGGLFNLLFYVFTVAYIIKRVRIGKWVFVVIGSFPIMVHTATSLSADVVNNVVILGFVAFIFNLFTQASRISVKQIALLISLVSLAALTKPVNVLLLLPLIFLPARLFKINPIRRIPFNLQKWSIGLVCVVLSMIYIIGWQKISGLPLVNAAPNNPLVNDPLHFFTILSSTYINPFIGYNDIVLRGVVGEFASFKYHLPTFVVIALFVVLLFSLLHKNKGEERSIQTVSLPLVLGSLGALFAFLFLITYTLYVAWAIQPFRLGTGAIYADGVQGRYFTALLALLVPLFIWLRRFIVFDTKSESVMGLIIFSLCGFSLLFYVLETYLFFN